MLSNYNLTLEVGLCMLNDVVGTISSTASMQIVSLINDLEETRLAYGILI